MKKKMIRILITVFVSIFFIISTYAQDNLGARLIIGTNNIENTTYHIYDPPFRAMVIYKDTIEAVNKYPEQLMSSMLSASNQDWVNYNTLGGAIESSKISQEEFDKVKKLSYDKNYFELLSKLEFEVNNDKMAIVKFYLYKEDLDKPVAGATVMQYINNRWYETSKPYTTSIAMALMIFKVNIMNSLLTGKGRNEMENDLIKKVYDNGLDFDKLLQQQNLSTEEKEYFTNPLNW